MKVTKSAVIPNAPELRGALGNIRFPAFVDVKLDGEFNFIHVEKNNTFSVNKYGTIRQDFTAINELEEDLLKEHSSVTFLAEIYWDKGKLGDLYALNSNKQSDDIKIYTFDILEIDGEDLRALPFIDRKEIMMALPRPNKSCSAGRMVNDIQEVQNCFDSVTLQDYEGIVVKPFEGALVLGPCDWVKMKKKDKTDYMIHKIDPGNERIEIMVPDANQNITIVGVKAINKYKKHLNVGMSVTIEHQGVLNSGSLRHPVLIAKPEWR